MARDITSKSLSEFRRPRPSPIGCVLALFRCVRLPQACARITKPAKMLRSCCGLVAVFLQVLLQYKRLIINDVADVALFWRLYHCSHLNERSAAAPDLQLNRRKTESAENNAAFRGRNIVFWVHCWGLWLRWEQNIYRLAPSKEH